MRKHIPYLLFPIAFSMLLGGTEYNPPKFEINHLLVGHMDTDRYIFDLNASQQLTVKQKICKAENAAPSGVCASGYTWNGSACCQGPTCYGVAIHTDCEDPEITIGNAADLHSFLLSLVAIEKAWDEAARHDAQR